jgi:GR25 family glycosyltransferase involved in LPS biosynthesis
MLKIFVLHYSKLVDRKKHILEQFQRLGITNFEFIEKYDKDELKPEDITIFRKDLSMTTSVISLTLKHLYAYSLVKELYPAALILEDDVILADNFLTKLTRYISELPDSYDMLFIGDACDLHIEESRLMPNKYVYEKCLYPTGWGGQGATRATDSYVISRQFAIKMFNYIKGLNNADPRADFFLNKALVDIDANVYWAEPTLVTQGTSTGLFKSSIVNPTFLPKKTIPRNIFQTWCSKELEPELLNIRDTMLGKNPGWKYYLYDDAEMESFVRDTYPDIYSSYMKLNQITAKADLWRYLVLYKYGGIYIDMDSSVDESLDTLIKEEDEAILTAEGNPGLYVQWALIFNKGHPILGHVIDVVVNNIKKNIYPTDILKMTGPGAFTKGIERYHNSLYVHPIPHNMITHMTDINYSAKGVPYRVYGIDYSGYFSFHHPFYKILYKNKKHWTEEKVKMLC